jgi:STE24 endopeptidase
MDASRRSSHGNAYFTGFGKNKRIVFFDNLIKTLEPEEVEAVLAHELGHFKKRHVLKGLAKSLIFSLIGFGVLGYVYNLKAFYVGHGVDNPSDYMALLLFSLVSGAYTFLLTPLSAITSRKHEFEADEFASENAKASKLISALVKLYKDNASTLTPDPLYSAFYHSHPPALIRVQHLEGLIVEEKGE